MSAILHARRRGARGAGRTVTGLVLSAMLALTLAAPVQPAGAASAPPSRADRDPSLRSAEEPLARPARGTRAVNRLGDRLPEVARLNGLSRRTLTTLLEDDASAWVDTDGRVFFRDPGPRGGELGDGTEPQASASAPLAETFALHSRPDAERKVFLDVDGSTVSGTGWNDGPDGVGASHPAWDPAGNGAAFSDDERTRVQTVWQMVAADFAAFDVDVTTEDPGAAGLSRATSGDSAYGAHVLITPSADAWDKICASGCGGVAYLSVFGQVDGGSPYYQPAWVFTDGLGDSTKGVAEATSHEVGHQLGLNHDGKDGSSYYGGHGVWGPIMGATYNRPVSQWSRGDYAGATTTQDDLAVIATRVPRVADEAGDTVSGAAPLPEGQAYLTTRTDVDTYALGECSGLVAASATTSDVGPDLDLRLSLLDADGSVVESADPASARVDSSRASGMDASLTVSVAAGSYHVSVEGVGSGTPSTGYDDYGSIGGYELSVAGCDGASPEGAPSAPVDLDATPDAVEPTVTLTWAEPADGGTSGITGYILTRSGSASPIALAAGARSHTLAGLRPDTDYTFTLSAQNSSGSGPSTLVTATTAAAPVQTPGAPRSFAASWDADDEAVRLSWLPPADDGGGQITEYRFSIDGDSAGGLPADARSAVGLGWDPGTYTVQIRAVNSAGEGSAATRTVTVPTPPLTTTTWMGRSVSGRSVSLRAIVRLVDADGSPPTGRVSFREDGVELGSRALQPLDDERAIARLVLEDVLPGDHTYRAEYSPDDSGLAPSSDAAVPVTLDRLASRTTVRVPRRARARTRPLVRVEVDGGPELARGRVKLVVRAVNGRTARRAVAPRLRRESLAFRLPRLRPGRVRVVARYGGSALHRPSRAARTIRVVRR